MFDKYRILQQERDLTREIEQWNELVRYGAPTLRLDPTQFTLPDGRVQAKQLPSALNAARTRYETDVAALERAEKLDRQTLAERSKGRDLRLRSVESSIQNLRDNLTRVGVARIRGSGDNTLALLLQNLDPKFGSLTPAGQQDDTKRQAFLDKPEAGLVSQLDELQKERERLISEDFNLTAQPIDWRKAKAIYDFAKKVQASENLPNHGVTAGYDPMMARGGIGWRPNNAGQGARLAPVRRLTFKHTETCIWRRSTNIASRASATTRPVKRRSARRSSAD